MFWQQCGAVTRMHQSLIKPALTEPKRECTPVGMVD
jgi:hypothetical protein